METSEFLERVYRVANQYQAAQKRPGRYAGQVLHAAETHMLEVIGGAPGIRATELAERLGVTKGAASQTMAKLQEKGLMRREAGTDGRAARLFVTEAGEAVRQAHQALHAPLLEAVYRALDGLSEEAREALMALTDVMMEHLIRITEDRKDAD